MNGLGVAECRAAAFAADDEGHRAMDVATPQCKELFASMIYSLGRYDCSIGVGMEHRSNSTLLQLATDPRTRWAIKMPSNGCCVMEVWISFRGVKRCGRRCIAPVGLAIRRWSRYLLALTSLLVIPKDTPTPLIAAATAAAYGHMDACRLLVAAGAVVDAVNDFNESALSLAVTGLHVEIVAMLIDAKADTNAPRTGGSATPGLRTAPPPLQLLAMLVARERGGGGGRR